jgi:hypothetical protein
MSYEYSIAESQMFRLKQTALLCAAALCISVLSFPAACLNFRTRIQIQAGFPGEYELEIKLGNLEKKNPTCSFNTAVGRGGGW